MGYAARQVRRAVGSVTACLLLAAGALGVDAACGLNVIGTGPALGDAEASGTDGGARADEASIGSGDASQGACSPDRTVCSSGCTDTTADPDNCGGCARKCEPGQTCNAGTCDVLCVGGTLRCSGACIDPSGTPAHCGDCTTACSGATPLCLDGKCKADCAPKTLCTSDAGADGGSADTCADTTSDRGNCGGCGVRCGPSQICQSSKCVTPCGGGATVSETFASTMIGCEKMNVTWDDRATLCAAGWSVCTPAQWNARRGTRAPLFNYWTSDYLQWLGHDQQCEAVPQGSGYTCNGTPMRVCGAKTDPIGNACRYTGCGYGTTTNQYFGGCQGDDYASGLCCTP